MLSRWITVLLVASVVTALFAGIRFYYMYPLSKARALAIPITPDLVKEARTLLQEHKTSGTETWYEAKFPPAMRSLDPDIIQVCAGGSAIELWVKGGPRPTALVVVENPATFASRHLPENHKQLNNHLWQYMR